MTQLLIVHIWLTGRRPRLSAWAFHLVRHLCLWSNMLSVLPGIWAASLAQAEISSEMQSMYTFTTFIVRKLPRGNQVQTWVRSLKLRSRSEAEAKPKRSRSFDFLNLWSRSRSFQFLEIRSRSRSLSALKLLRSIDFLKARSRNRSFDFFNLRSRSRSCSIDLKSFGFVKPEQLRTHVWSGIACSKLLVSFSILWLNDIYVVVLV